VRVRRRPGVVARAGGVVNPLALISIALRFPDATVTQARDEVADAAHRLPDTPARRALFGFLDWWTGLSSEDLRRRYVETFDFSRRTALDLTYYTHGDRRQRGIALLRLRQRYDAAGLELEGSELPDHLPVVLEFAVLDPVAGTELLTELRPVIELVRLSLERAESPFAGLLSALCLTLPDMDEEQLAEVRRLAREGPPGETVGLEPFAPPEVMPDPVRRRAPAACDAPVRGVA